MSEPLELTYALHLLPRGRIALRRWRWELWHESHLLAAGWRSIRCTPSGPCARTPSATCTACTASPLPSQATHPAERAWGGGSTAFHWGELQVVLTPRALLDASRAGAL